VTGTGQRVDHNQVMGNGERAWGLGFGVKGLEIRDKDLGIGD
jgi:hypothetical protein